MNLKEFSRITGVPYRTLQGYILEGITPGGDNLMKICDKFSISSNWLLTGEGPMCHNENKENKDCPEWLREWWEKAREKERGWLEVELKRLRS